MRALRLNAWRIEPGHEDAPRPGPELVEAPDPAAGDIAGGAVIAPFTDYEADA